MCQRPDLVEVVVDVDSISTGNRPLGGQNQYVFPRLELDVPNGLADDRRLGYGIELDEVQVTGVVEDHSRCRYAADGLDCALNVDQGRIYQVRTEALGESRKRVRIIESESTVLGVNGVRSAGSFEHQCEALIDASQGRAGRAGSWSSPGVTFT